jgi:hypothetical protein
LLRDIKRIPINSTELEDLLFRFNNKKCDMSTSPQEKTVTNWKEFCDFCHNISLDQNEEPIFRGCKDKEWYLITSINWELNNLEINPQLTEEIERKFIDKFNKKWFFEEMKYYLKHNALYRMLSIMQHYGIKTRMLDWSGSEYVAAFFATEDDKKFNDKDSVVWCIKKAKIEEQFRTICKEYDKRSDFRGKRCELNLCWDQSNVNHCPVKELCNNGQYFKCNAIFFEDVLSTATDVRMIIQASYFTYSPNPIIDHTDCIAKILGEETSTNCVKIIIPSNLKTEFRNELENINYVKERLYPNSEKVEKWCMETLKSVISEYKNLNNGGASPTLR